MGAGEERDRRRNKAREVEREREKVYSILSSEASDFVCVGLGCA